MSEPKLIKSNNISKTIWSIVREMKRIENATKEIQMPSDFNKIANDLNEYISNAAIGLSSQLKYEPYSCTIKLNSRSIFIRPQKALDILKKIKNNFSSGYEVPTFIF